MREFLSIVWVETQHRPKQSVCLHDREQYFLVWQNLLQSLKRMQGALEKQLLNLLLF